MSKGGEREVILRTVFLPDDMASDIERKAQILNSTPVGILAGYTIFGFRALRAQEVTIQSDFDLSAQTSLNPNGAILCGPTQMRHYKLPFEPDYLEKVDQEAEKRGTPFNSYFIEAIQKALEVQSQIARAADSGIPAILTLVEQGRRSSYRVEQASGA